MVHLPPAIQQGRVLEVQEITSAHLAYLRRRHGVQVLFWQPDVWRVPHLLSTSDLSGIHLPKQLQSSCSEAKKPQYNVTICACRCNPCLCTCKRFHRRLSCKLSKGPACMVWPADAGLFGWLDPQTSCIWQVCCQLKLKGGATLVEWQVPYP